MNKRYYFAYGSNMDEKKIIKRGVKFFRKFPGQIKDWKLVFVEFLKYDNESGYANIIPCKNSSVEGIIYEVDNSVDNLDKYECVPIDYFKKEIEVISNNTKFNCLVYIGNNKNIGLNKSPNKKYMSELLEGKDFLSKRYYQMLKSIKTI